MPLDVGVNLGLELVILVGARHLSFGHCCVLAVLKCAYAVGSSNMVLFDTMLAKNAALQVKYCT